MVLGSRESLLEELAELDERRNKIALEHGHHLLEAAKNQAEEMGAEDVHVRQRHGDLAESLTALEDNLRLSSLAYMEHKHVTAIVWSSD